MDHLPDPATMDHWIEFSARWGVLQCMRMLVEEAAALNMLETAAALERAIALCQAEAGVGWPEPSIMSH